MPTNLFAYLDGNVSKTVFFAVLNDSLLTMLHCTWFSKPYVNGT